MQNLESALKTLLLKRTESTEESINAIAEPVNGRGCLYCMDDDQLAAAVAEFRQSCIEAGHHDVVEVLDGDS